jgi:hypothetical protein
MARASIGELRDAEDARLQLAADSVEQGLEGG